jgi:hypothetical protein
MSIRNVDYNDSQIFGLKRDSSETVTGIGADFSAKPEQKQEVFHIEIGDSSEYGQKWRMEMPGCSIFDIRRGEAYYLESDKQKQGWLD